MDEDLAMEVGSGYMLGPLDDGELSKASDDKLPSVRFAGQQLGEMVSDH